MDWEYSASVEPELPEVLTPSSVVSLGSRNVPRTLGLSRGERDVDIINDSTHITVTGMEGMDVDPSDHLVIVPDTNIWIGHPDLLKTILNTDFDKVSYPTIIIPWMVMQELDLLGKQGTKGKSSYEKDNNNPRAARKSISFIHELLDSKHPRVRGQKASEAALAQEQFKAENADDKILQCALQCVQNPRFSIVVFLTNDRNLLSKAMVESSEDIRRRLLICDTNETLKKIGDKIYLEMGGRSVRTAGTSSWTKSVKSESLKHDIGSSSLIKLPRPSSPRRRNSAAALSSTSKVIFYNTPKSQSPEAGKPLRKPLKRNRDSSSRAPLCAQPVVKKTQLGSPGATTRSTRTRTASSIETSTNSLQISVPAKVDTFKEVLEFLRSVFSCILEFKMKEDFGEKLWTHSLVYKPPWTLHTALKCLIRHHFAVFSYVFGTRSKPQIESLLSMLEDYLANQDKKERRNNEIENDIIELALTLIMLARTKGGGLDKKLKLDECEKILVNYLKEHKS